MTDRPAQEALAAVRKHRPTLYRGDQIAAIHCACGFRDHMDGWFAHLTIEVLERTLLDAAPQETPS